MKSENFKKKNKRNILIMMSLLIICFIVIGVSYAIWQITLTQTDKNIITTSCFKIEFQDNNPINLEKSYPILNEEGKSLTPYEFTITNTCDTYATYQINLEILNDSTLMSLDTIRVLLNETSLTKDSVLLETNEQIETTLSNATKSYKLETGYLNKQESKTFHLKLWLDENTPTDETYMNKTFLSKITVITSYLNESPSYAEVITNCSNNGYKTTTCMLNNSAYDTTNLAYDETVDNNLRYIGATPNNYVDFNGEKWRIIGVMNNISDGNGNIDSRIKLIRNDSIGEYSWDTSPSNINIGYGINEWSEADLMKLLNPGYESENIGGSLYWNRSSGNCYNGANNEKIACDFTLSGLNEEFKSYIEEVIWHTGSNGQITWKEIKTPEFYNLEKSGNTGKICNSGNFCNDTVERTITWKGLVGLMYPSDYGYATGGGKTCLNKILFNWKNDLECTQNNWLHQTDFWQWTLTPLAVSASSSYVFYVYDGNLSYAGTLFNGSAYGKINVRPVIYLKSNTKIISGEGTIDNMYVISLR